MGSSRLTLAALALLVCAVALGVRHYESQVWLHAHPPPPEPPLLHMNGYNLHVEDRDQIGETVFFAHSLFFSGDMWRAQMAHFNALGYRCVALDFRGQGRSEIPVGGAPIGLDALADDVIGVIEALDVGPVHYVGLSMGSMTGLRVALKRPDLLRSMTLMAVSADAEETSNGVVNTVLAWIVKWFGLNAYVRDTCLYHMFSATFMAQHSAYSEGVLADWGGRMMAYHPTGIIAALEGVWERDSILRDVVRIDQVPTLVMHGSEDRSIPLAHARAVFERFPSRRAQFIELEHTGHLMNLERPALVNKHLGEFFEETSTAHEHDM